MDDGDQEQAEAADEAAFDDAGRGVGDGLLCPSKCVNVPRLRRMSWQASRQERKAECWSLDDERLRTRQQRRARLPYPGRAPEIDDDGTVRGRLSE